LSKKARRFMDEKSDGDVAPQVQSSIMLELAKRSTVHIDAAKCIRAFFGGIATMLALIIAYWMH